MVIVNEKEVVISIETGCLGTNSRCSTFAPLVWRRDGGDAVRRGGEFGQTALRGAPWCRRRSLLALWPRTSDQAAR